MASELRPISVPSGNDGAFDHVMLSPEENVLLDLDWCGLLPWADFLLNPRHLRGSDFLMRWSQGRWSEEQIIQALNSTNDYHAIPYGPSGAAPHDLRKFELYFERLEAAGLRDQKRPDVLVFNKSDEKEVELVIKRLGGYQELPFTVESKLQSLQDRAIIAVECENSLWKGKLMPEFGKPMTPQKRLDGKLGFPKTAVLPTIILKDQDLSPLAKWQGESKIPIHIWHVFFDMAFGISFDSARKLIQGTFD